jgi:hypothetical protein
MTQADPSASPSHGRDPTREQMVELRRKIVEHFNDEELRTLCFDIGADYESLPAQGKEGKARELIAFQQRLGRLADLIAACHAARPNVHWDLGSGPPPAGFQPVGRWQMQVSDGSAWLMTFFPNGSFIGQGIGMWWGAGAQASGGWIFFIPAQTLQLQGAVNNMLPIMAVLVIQGQQAGGYYALGNDGKGYVFTRA